MSNQNSIVVVPPPDRTKSDAVNLGGIVLDILPDSVLDMSYSYQSDSADPTMNCLFIIQVRDKGSMSFRWANPEWTKSDLRAENMNKNLGNNKIIIIYAKEMLLNNAHGKEASMAFWNTNQMKEMTKPAYAPDTERWAGEIKGVANSIQIVDGYVKIVDLT